MTVSGILIIISIVCFVLAAFGVAIGAVGLVPLGLAFFAAAHLELGGTRVG